MDLFTADVQVRQLHARYVDAVWRKDLAAFSDCFVADAYWDLDGTELRGRDEITAAFGRIIENYRGVMMTFRTPLITIHDGVVSARTYVNEQRASKAAGPSTAFGVYSERFVVDPDGWRFSWRVWRTVFRGAADLQGEFFGEGDPPLQPSGGRFE